MTLNIAVCIKPVPDSRYYNKIIIDPKTKCVNRDEIETVINAMDKNAVEAAIKLKEKNGGKITIFSMAPDNAVKNLRKVLAMGADEAYLCSDKALGGSDTLVTSYVLAKAIQKTGNYDVIILGNQSEDGGTAQVPSQLGEWLNIPHFVNVKSLELEVNKIVAETKTENGSIKFKVRLPALFGVIKDINEPRIPNVMGVLKAKNKPLTIFRATDLDLDEGKIGLKGSPTQVGEIFSPDMKRKSQKIEGAIDEIAEKIIEVIKRAGIGL